MSDPTIDETFAADPRLAELWRLTEAPARDHVFALGVEEAVARRRMQIDVASRCALAAVAAAALWVLGPGLVAGAGQMAASFDAVGPALAAVAMIGAAMVWLNRTPEEA